LKINMRNFRVGSVSKASPLRGAAKVSLRLILNRRYTKRMNAHGETATDTQELERLLRKLLAPSRLPSYINSARYELGTDHIGEPAVRVFLEITPETDVLLSKDKVKLKAYSDYKDELSSRILNIESGYFPYIRLVEAA
jgi:hypothetical protein